MVTLFGIQGILVQGKGSSVDGFRCSCMQPSFQLATMISGHPAPPWARGNRLPIYTGQYKGFSKLPDIVLCRIFDELYAAIGSFASRPTEFLRICRASYIPAKRAFLRHLPFGRGQMDATRLLQFWVALATGGKTMQAMIHSIAFNLDATDRYHYIGGSHLEYNELEDIALYPVLGILKGHLRALYLKVRGSKATPEDIKQLIGSCLNIEILDMEGGDISVTTLAQMRHLRTLYLVGVDLLLGEHSSADFRKPFENLEHFHFDILRSVSKDTVAQLIELLPSTLKSVHISLPNVHGFEKVWSMLARQTVPHQASLFPGLSPFANNYFEHLHFIKVLEVNTDVVATLSPLPPQAKELHIRKKFSNSMSISAWPLVTLLHSDLLPRGCKILLEDYHRFSTQEQQALQAVATKVDVVLKAYYPKKAAGIMAGL